MRVGEESQKLEALQVSYLRNDACLFGSVPWAPANKLSHGIHSWD